MRPALGILLLVLLQISGSWGQRPRKPPKKPENPIEKIRVKDNFNFAQFAGKWFLIGVASECEYLKENNHRVEATTIVVSPKATEKKTLPISTFRKLDGICWEIKHEYKQSKVAGSFILKVRGYNSNVDVLVGDTDYNTYAVLYYQKQRKLSIKLYGSLYAPLICMHARSANVADNIIQKYEKAVSEQGIAEDFIYYFPKYVWPERQGTTLVVTVQGFCDSADQFHILKD